MEQPERIRKELSCVMIYLGPWDVRMHAYLWRVLSLNNPLRKENYRSAHILSRLKRNIMVHISAQYVSA